MKKILVLVPLTVMLAACSKSENGHDDAYFEAHLAEVVPKVKACNRTPEETSSECLAANRVLAKHMAQGGKPVFATGNEPVNKK